MAELDLCNRDEVLYNEVKEAMFDRRTDTAVTLLNLLPDQYKNAQKYREQCQTYDSLCNNGIIECDDIVDLRDRLSVLLHEDPSSRDLTRYSNALIRRGFNIHAINTCTLHTMNEAMDAAGMSEGHRQLFSDFSRRNTPMALKNWMDVLNALEKCAPLVSCLRAGKSKNDNEDNTNDDEDEEK